jgi:hypothetical protein
MADAGDSKSPVLYGHEGSTPSSGTSDLDRFASAGAAKVQRGDYPSMGARPRQRLRQGQEVSKARRSPSADP